MSAILKPQRIVDRDLLSSYWPRRCVVCGHRGCDPDHIQSRGSGGDDIDSNLWPLCRRHHTERHTIGIISLVKKYPGLELTLKLKGWTVTKLGLIKS